MTTKRRSAGRQYRRISEQLNSSLDILEASTAARPKITFEDFVDHSLLKKLVQQENK